MESVKEEQNFVERSHNDRIELYVPHEGSRKYRIGVREYAKFLRGESFVGLNDKRICIHLKKLDTVNHLCMLDGVKTNLQIFYSKAEFSNKRYIVEQDQPTVCINRVEFITSWKVISMRFFNKNGEKFTIDRGSIVVDHNGNVFSKHNKLSWGWQNNPFGFRTPTYKSSSYHDYEIIKDISDLKSSSDLSLMKIIFPNDAFKERFLKIFMTSLFVEGASEELVEKIKKQKEDLWAERRKIDQKINDLERDLHNAEIDQLKELVG